MTTSSWSPGSAWPSGSRRPTSGRWAVDAAGVRGMNLRDRDEVVSIDPARDETSILIVTEAGFGKRTQLQHFHRQNRGGSE